MDLEKISKLIDFVGASRISELTVTENGVTVRIVREREQQQPLPSRAQTTHASPALVAAVADEVVIQPVVAAEIAGDRIVAAPSFGLFHRAPSPDAPPFVQIGDHVSEGQDLFIIEAMKVFNTVKAERSGKVARILANEGDDVEFGQPVLELE